MKKILAQYYVDNNDVSNYNVIYTVPAWLQTTIASIYVNATGSSSKEEMEINYNIRIVKNGDPVDPNTAGTSQQMAEETYKNSIINRPMRGTKDYPDRYKDITLEEWDSIVLQSMTLGIAVSIFWEELQYDFDDLVSAIHWVTGALNALDATRQTFPACYSWP